MNSGKLTDRSYILENPYQVAGAAFLQPPNALLPQGAGQGVRCIHQRRAGGTQSTQKNQTIKIRKIRTPGILQSQHRAFPLPRA